MLRVMPVVLPLWADSSAYGGGAQLRNHNAGGSSAPNGGVGHFVLAVHLVFSQVRRG